MTRRGFLFSGTLFAFRIAGAAGAELRLELTVSRSALHAGQPIPLTWTLENISPHPLEVLAFHSAGGGPQFDELHLSGSRNGGPAQLVSLAGPRAASRRVWKKLAPGERLPQEFDLARAMELSGKKAEAGAWQFHAEYVQRANADDYDQPVWHGSIAAEFAFRIDP